MSSREAFIVEAESIFKCFEHSFSTADLDEWFKHKFSVPHWEIGKSICIYCRKNVIYGKSDTLFQMNLDHTVPAVCPNCSHITGIQSNCRLANHEEL